MGGDLLATAGECVKIWMVQEQSTKLLCNIKLASNDASMGNPFDAPLTNFDWNPNKTNLLATTQVNGIASVWDLVTMQSQ